MHVKVYADMVSPPKHVSPKNIDTSIPAKHLVPIYLVVTFVLVFLGIKLLNKPK
jgi:hypothetical protein